jgi:hypothetical protein
MTGCVIENYLCLERVGIDQFILCFPHYFDGSARLFSMIDRGAVSAWPACSTLRTSRSGLHLSLNIIFEGALRRGNYKAGIIGAGRTVHKAVCPSSLWSVACCAAVLT